MRKIPQRPHVAPRRACNTDEPYVFISYSSKDRDEVYREIVHMQNERYRIWYDAGIGGGEVYWKTISKAIRDCALFLVFISPNSVSSPFVEKEIYLADEKKIERVPVYLKATPLPEGLDLTFSGIQRISKYDKTHENYWAELERILPITTREQHGPAPSIPTPEQQAKQTPIGIRAYLELISDPQGASVWVDGQDTGKVTPFRYSEILKTAPSRDVEIELKKPSYEDDPFEVTLQRGINHPVTRTLIDNYGHLHITSTPPGATVTIDGTKLSEVTPCDYHVDLSSSLVCDVDISLALIWHDVFHAQTTLHRSNRQQYDATLMPINVPQLGDIHINPQDDAPMVYVPAGPFIMGAKNEADNLLRTEELPAYWVYQTPVTVAQYRAFCLATGRHMPAAPYRGWKDNHPIVNVTWQDATDYATWAGATLPVEAEWEKAARGTDGRVYPWGNKWDADMCVNEKNSDYETARVGSFPENASPYGALDMVGNVWQWCADPYDDLQTVRTQRGGSWDIYNPNYFRAYCRNGCNSTDSSDSIGFRCVVHPPEP